MTLAEHIEHLPRDMTDPTLSPTRRLMLTLLARLQLVEMPRLCEVDDLGQRPHLAEVAVEVTRAAPWPAPTPPSPLSRGEGQ